MKILNGNLIEQLVFGRGYLAHPTACMERERECIAWLRCQALKLVTLYVNPSSMIICEILASSCNFSVSNSFSVFVTFLYPIPFIYSMRIMIFYPIELL